VQWAHLASFATWVGGLAALLIAVGTEPSPAKAAAVRRFSQVAAASLAVVGLTGLLRALDEVAAWAALAGTLFGQLVVVKVALLVALAGLGAWNRFRSVPVVERSLHGLRRVGRLEVGVAAVVLVASAILTSLVPPFLVQAAARQQPPPMVLARATSVQAVKATLEITPGYPGQNRFTLRAYDAKTSRAVDGTVTLRFEMPARPEVAESALELTRAADGSYVALGDNLTLIGDWRVTALVDQSPVPLQVPFQVTCSPTPQQLHQMTMGSMPMVYGVHLANGWQLQAYLTPGRSGRNTLHLAFTDQRNGPVVVRDDPVVTARLGSATRSLQVLRLAFGTPTNNQFYAVGTFAAGRWDFHVTATAEDETRLDTRFSLTLGR
jgi:hypothetical protein